MAKRVSISDRIMCGRGQIKVSRRRIYFPLTRGCGRQERKGNCKVYHQSARASLSDLIQSSGLRASFSDRLQSAAAGSLAPFSDLFRWVPPFLFQSKVARATLFSRRQSGPVGSGAGTAATIDDKRNNEVIARERKLNSITVQWDAGQEQ